MANDDPFDIINSVTDWADLMEQINGLLLAYDDNSSDPEEMAKLDEMIEALDNQLEIESMMEGINDRREIKDIGQIDGGELSYIIPNAVFAFVYLATLILVQFSCEGIIHHAYTLKAIVLMISCTYRAGSAGVSRLNPE